MALRQTEPTEVKVGDNKFYITPFAAFKAANLSGELASVLAPLLGALAPLFGDGTDTEGIMDVDVGKAAEAMMNCTTISGDKLEFLMKKLLLGGHIVVKTENDDGEIEAARLDADLVNEIFCGEIQDMFILCFHVIKLNFGGFFKKLAIPSGKAGSAKKKAPRKVL